MSGHFAPRERAWEQPLDRNVFGLLNHFGDAELGSMVGGRGLVVEGKTEDGLVEAVRYDGDWWVVGVQWHPERMNGDHQRIFASFRDAMAQSRSRDIA